MSGMINAAVPGNGAAPANGAAQPYKWTSPVLEQAEQRNEAGIAPSNRQAYNQIVLAGMAAGLSREDKSLVAKMLKNPDPVKAAARGTVALALILRREANAKPNNVMPANVMILAGLTLMFHALDLIARSGKVKIGAPELNRAAHIFSNDMFGAFNITPAMLHAAVARVHAITMDPVAMEMINRKAGVVRHPNASVPTFTPAA